MKIWIARNQTEGFYEKRALTSLPGFASLKANCCFISLVTRAWLLLSILPRFTWFLIESVNVNKLFEVCYVCRLTADNRADLLWGWNRTKTVITGFLFWLGLYSGNVPMNSMLKHFLPVSAPPMSHIYWLKCTFNHMYEALINVPPLTSPFSPPSVPCDWKTQT